MGKYSQKDWYLRISKENIEKYGDVPPPWIYGPTMSPYSIGWRMGGGETHIMVLGEWLEQQNYTQEQRIAYVRKYPPPPRWMEWVARFIWHYKDDNWDDIDYDECFTKLKEFGFEGVDDFEKDLDDDRWD